MSKGFKMVQDQAKEHGKIEMEVLTWEEIQKRFEEGTFNRGVFDSYEFTRDIDTSKANFFLIMFRGDAITGVFHDAIRMDSDTLMHRDIDLWKRSIFQAFCAGFHLVMDAEYHDEGYLPRTIDYMIEGLQALKEGGDFSGFSSHYNRSQAYHDKRAARIHGVDRIHPDAGVVTSKKKKTAAKKKPAPKKKPGRVRA